MRSRRPDTAEERSVSGQGTDPLPVDDKTEGPRVGRDTGG